VVITNDETLTAEDVALAYKSGAIIESCFRRMKQTRLEVRPMFHWAPRRIEAHVKLCVLALQVQRTAEIRTGLSWARIAHLLGMLKAVRYVAERQTIVQRTKITGELAELLKKLGIPIPKQLLTVTEAPETSATA
jgi:transposase